MELRLPQRGKWLRFIGHFAALEAQACTFPFALVGLLAFTRLVDLPWLPRYDWMFVFCVVIQLVMVAFKLETWRDAAVVAVFHVLGMGIELYKVSAGSWAYPGESILAIGPVPLYAGFMHGSIASFMCLAWKKHRLRASGWPPAWTAISVAALIYLQFFTASWVVEARLLTLLTVLLVFRNATVHFDCIGERWKIPMPLAFGLIGSMIYVAENIGTYLGAWTYPYQVDHWTVVHPSKMLSWTLLMTVSLIVVAEYKRRLSLLDAADTVARAPSSA